MGSTGMRDRGVVAAVVLALALGCGEGDEGAWAQSAEDAIVVADASSIDAALVIAVTESATDATTAESAAEVSAESVASLVSPEGCLVSSTSGARVTYTFDGCTGPYGLATIDGTLEVAYAITAGGALNADLSASALTIGGTAIVIDASATYSESGGTESIEIVLGGSVSGPRGRTATRSGEITASWDASCVAIDGAISSTFGERAWDATIDAYRRCADACPSGSITWTGSTGSVAVSFDGTADASWQTGGAREDGGSIALACGG